MASAINYKNFFTDSDIIHYSIITHIHAIVSLGGLNKKFQYKKIKYFHVNSIANQWKYLLCNLINNANYPNNNIKLKAKEYIRFFFNIGDNYVNDPKGIIKYLARVPIAEYKIVDINFKKNYVTFMFNDLANNKEITYHTLSIQEFVAKLLFHLPYKHFKMINRFGFYSRRKSSKLKAALTLFKSELKKVPSLFKKNFKSIWDLDPFMCPNCNTYLEIFELFVSSPFGRPIHKIYNPNGLLFK
ncbi:transposase [Streptobacillus felis]|uniref:transposase n=1 Tax=Streptobacillus felis TaxID=1384509 RepID=UPI000834B022|nr:transposase [Streptobacillus felis]